MTGPLRIKKLTLCDYRAFPGPVPAEFDLDGKNWLVYGENGAGKSSIFYALAEFFSFSRRYTLGDRKNVFSGAPAGDMLVRVEFDDGVTGAEWKFDAHGKELHPTDSSDVRVIEATMRRACLDYRALLDTNYGQGHGAVNLFEIARDRLLAEYEATVDGGKPRRIRDLWRDVEAARPLRPIRQYPKPLARVNEACKRFNVGFQLALDALQKQLPPLLDELSRGGVELKSLAFPGVTWNRYTRVVEGQTLTPEVRFRNHLLPVPQHFLNEARLSSLALAIYFAGRLASVPAGRGHELKLLVLDDVLIGLDHENRRPVLQVIKKFFADWQVVLLTHDLAWFEIAREHTENDPSWGYEELFEGFDPARGILVPSVRLRPERGSVEKELKSAEDCLTRGELGPAANRARVAWEHLLRVTCDIRGIPVPYKRDPRKVDTEMLGQGIEDWVAAKHSRTNLKALLAATFVFRRTVFNDGSHTPLTTFSTRDVRDAIAAVRKLHAEFQSLR